MNEQWLTGKISLMIAGAIGGLLSLAFIKNLSPLKSFAAILAGGACAYYITPVVDTIYNFEQNIEDAMAFLIGLAGMNIMAGIFELSVRFKKKPLSTINEIIRGKNEK